jgi:hypothetical protein
VHDGWPDRHTKAGIEHRSVFETVAGVDCHGSFRGPPRLD